MSSLQGRIGPQKYRAWFKSGTSVTLDDGHLKVAVASPFAANWIEGHYLPDLAQAAQEHTGRNHNIVVTVDPELSGQMRKRTLDAQADMVDKATTGRCRSRKDTPRAALLRYSMDDFVVGESNRLAYSAAKAVSKASTPPFNPLFVHGPCGVGKTHLLQGICSDVRRRRLSWRYVTAEQFTNEFIAALRQKKVDAFRNRYRSLDLLAIDDVHFLAAKKATQDEFLHTYNAIESSGKQIVLASDVHPRLVGELNEQLISRFVSGMVVKVDSPDLTTRMEILRRRARAMKLDLAPDVLEYVAMHIRQSVRELEGTMIKLAALSALGSGKVTLAMATEALADHLARTDSVVTLGDIEALVAAYFGITPADLHSTRRTRTVSAARMVAMTLARQLTQMSFPEIGRCMGKNHSSVLLAVKRMEKLLAENGEVSWKSPGGPRSLPARKLLELLNEQLG
ncbi:MAG: chromosomal replication initiator protein DnaA [Phycisphaerae bacterium]